MLIATRKVIVFDTNLFISAIIHPERICATGLKIAATHFDIAVSNETQSELLEVPSRSYLEPYASREVRQFRTLAYLQILKHFEITEQVTDCKDKKDNMFLSLAVGAMACALVSGDKRDLIKMNPYKGIPIITMREFVEGYEGLL